MKKGRVTKYSIIAVILFAIIIGSMAIWLYTGKINPVKEKVLSVLPVPIAFANKHPILMRDFSARFNIYSKLNTQNPPIDNQTLKQNVINAIIQENKVTATAAKYGVYISSKELDHEYQALAQKSDLPDGQNFNDLLKAFGLTQQSFKTYILKPQALSTKLNVWFNNQENLNAGAYKTANNLKAKIDKGDDIADLAKTFSQELNSKTLDGDMGFVSISELLPELGEPIDSMAKDQVKIVASRYGLHIVKLLDKNNNGPQGTQQVHLSQIFIETNDFGQWLANETKNMQVKILINPAN